MEYNISDVEINEILLDLIDIDSLLVNIIINYSKLSLKKIIFLAIMY